MKCCKIFTFLNGLVIILFILNGTKGEAETSCTANDNCNENEFCDTNSTFCKLCLDCSHYNRDSKSVLCPKDAIEDCGNCFHGYTSSSQAAECKKLEDHPLGGLDMYSVSETTLEIFPSTLLTSTLGALVSDKAHHEKTNEIVTETLTQEKSKDETTVPQTVSESHTTTEPRKIAPTTILYKDDDDENLSTLPRIKLLKSPIQKESAILTDDQVNSSFVQEDDTEIDYGNKNAPWAYVALGFTLFILFGTAGVVSFKYYILPKQLEEKRMKRQILARENDKNRKKDLQNASSEERERLYYDELSSSNKNYIGLNYTKIYGKK